MIPFVITGDTHREYGRLIQIAEIMKKYENYQEKYICVTGDFGYIFEDTKSEQLLLDDMEKQNFIFVVVPGNHENYAAFQKCPVVDFNGAKAHKIRKNIFYIKRGEIFTIANKNFFCMGGGNSVDRYMRKENISWWKDEMPTDAEYRYAADNIEKYRAKGEKIDYIISHTAPLSGLVYLHKDHGPEEYPLNNFLEYVRETVEDEYIMHFFGHLHIDKEMPSIKQRALFYDYVELMFE